MTEETRPDLDITQQEPDAIAAVESILDWGRTCDALAADILTQRKGRPLDIDALLQADRAELEARDDDIFKGRT